MYSVFKKLCESKGVTPYKIWKDTGIARSTFSDWKSGKSTPKQDKLKLIAGYFGVSLEYLMTGEDTRYSEEDALLDVKISEDSELKMAIKKYYSLDDHKKKLVIELINMFSEV